ncbi:MAG TPA: exodeoxyribonuclease VII large subunit [Flexistipes sinusarabici]|uniref:Exodeoxyribonuclease 7 large subunit n=1 Tax=Flexistipes sinusarabici TaxID=2352 RepID=A0A3D5QE32_FLESI|nr:exodeoxyribonuclease VII large subunit [Flexistipes sinusarabici]
MKTYTVTEITKAIKNLIEQTFSYPVIVTGEVSNFSTSPAGHQYFILKDESSQIKCVFFKRYNLLNRDYSIKNGDKVSVYGDLSVFEAGGNYQIVAKKIEYSSEGEFYKKFEETKKKLEEEGLFHEDLKKPVPTFVKKIAVVTSPSGAAIRDFIITTKRNNAAFEIDIWPTTVQGASAAGEIEKNILKAGSRGDEYDALVLMRGGGSLEDLAVFNEENVARALRKVEVPTISAIGHQRDFTICDFTADLRVATPTAAASYLSEGYIYYDKNLTEFYKRLVRYMEQVIIPRSQKLDNYMAVLNKNSPYNRISLYRSELERSRQLMINNLRNKMQDGYSRLKLCDVFLASKKPAIVVREKRSEVERFKNYLLRSVTNRLNYDNERLKGVFGRLKTMNPENVISRGYALVYKEGFVVESLNSIKLDDEVEIRMKGGYINAFVTGKKHLEDTNG